MSQLKLGLALAVCLMLVPALASALTYTTPNPNDGVVESATPVLGGTEWETDEFMDIDGGTNFYLTWDSTHVYCAITGTYADQQEGDYDWFIALDYDQTPGSGATSDGYAHVTFEGDFLPEYILYFAGDGGWHEASVWDTSLSAWNWLGWTDTCSYGGWDGNFTSEICLEDTSIVDADSIAVASWISTEDNSTIVASFPSANPIGAKSQPMKYFWVAKNRGKGIAPVTLPVQPTPPTVSVDNERDFPYTCTVLADITPGNCGSTTQMAFYYTDDGSDPDEMSSFVVGTYDACTVGADTTDTFYAIIPAADEATVRWIAMGVAKNALVDWSDEIQEFVQGGTAWVGNAGSSPTTCTIWAEVYVGDGGQTTYINFPYTTDGSDPRVSAGDTADGVFDTQLGNNDKFYAELTAPAPGVTVNWYAFGEDAYNNYAETDTFYTFVQGDTAEILNLICEPDSNFVMGEVAPPGLGAGMDFHWTTDGSDPKTSGTASKASGYHVEDTDTTGKFAAYLTASVGQTIKWYVHAWGSNNAYSDSPIQTCVAGTTSGPILCNLTCVPESLIVRASISPRGYGSEITFYAAKGADPKTATYVCEIPGGYVRDEDTPTGDCSVPVGVFQAELPGSLAVGDSVFWYAHGWYQSHNKYNGLFGDSDTQTCVPTAPKAGITPRAETTIARITNVPNPFGGSTQIVFDLSRKSRVAITAYDIRGRSVARVFEGTLSQGPNAITWNGLSDSGSELPSGIYFFRFEAGKFAATRKAMLVR
ncbi:MAG: FlgD immunoglobulin-like domain containing protein [Candidatus Eisenbacteria bacterium]